MNSDIFDVPLRAQRQFGAVSVLDNKKSFAII